MAKRTKNYETKNMDPDRKKEVENWLSSNLETASSSLLHIAYHSKNMTVFEELLKHPDIDVEKTYKDLRAYCKRDTLAMVLIHEALHKQKT